MPPHHGAGAPAACDALSPLPAVNPAVEQQYVDNIRWIREASRHRLVRARPGGGRVGSWTLPEVRGCSPPGPLRRCPHWPPHRAATGRRSPGPFRRGPGLRGNNWGQAGLSSPHSPAGPWSQVSRLLRCVTWGEWLGLSEPPVPSARWRCWRWRVPPGCGVGLGAGRLTLCGARAGGTGISVTVSVTTSWMTRGGDWFTRTRS